MASTKRLSLEEWVERCNAIHNNRYDYSKTIYRNYRENVTIICPIHGEFIQKAASHAAGSGCQKCARERVGRMHRGNKFAIKKPMRPAADCIAELNKIHGGKYDYSKARFTSMTAFITVVCPVHGEFSIIYKNHLAGKGCPACRRRKLSDDDFMERVKAAHGDRYQYKLDEYVNYVTPMTIICPVHGEFKQCPREHFRGYGCRACAAAGSSTLEELVLSWFPHLKQSDRTVLDKKEIDLLDVERKVGIEINGDYWHCEKNTTQNYHQMKTDLAESRGYQLLHFWEYEINSKPDIVKSIIASKLGMTRRIHARKCEIVNLDYTKSKNLEKLWHIQGHSPSSIRYGLKYNGHIVALMTFGRSRFDHTYDWELIRYCTRLNTTVVGGASRLLKHFMKHHAGSIMSYANRRISNGKLYEKLGFVRHSTTPPNYVWIKDGRVLSRYACQKGKLETLAGIVYNPGETEIECMTRNGYTRLFDSGNIKFVMEVK